MLYRNYNMGGRKIVLGFRPSNPPPERIHPKWYRNPLKLTERGEWVFPTPTGPAIRNLAQDFWVVRIQGV